MLIELPKSEYSRVRSLFDVHKHHKICMCGFADPETRIVVDSVKNPQSALMVTRDCWGFLVGNPHNTAFNQALNKALWNRDIVSKEIWGLLLTAHPDDWHGQLPAIVAPSTLVPYPRRHFTTGTLRFDWRSAVPDGYVIHPLDKILLERYPGIEIPEDAQKLLNVEDPITQGFGFAAIYNDTVTAHAMIDFIQDSEGEIGLFTQETHRRKGLATVTSAACIEFGLSHGLKRVRWECHTENAGSLRTAEKLGFTREFDYLMHYFDF